MQLLALSHVHSHIVLTSSTLLRTPMMCLVVGENHMQAAFEIANRMDIIGYRVGHGIIIGHPPDRISFAMCVSMDQAISLNTRARGGAPVAVHDGGARAGRVPAHQRVHRRGRARACRTATRATWCCGRAPPRGPGNWLRGRCGTPWRSSTGRWPGSTTPTSSRSSTSPAPAPWRRSGWWRPRTRRRWCSAPTSRSTAGCGSLSTTSTSAAAALLLHA